YATKPGDTLHQGDGSSGTGWNYRDGGFATDPYGTWDVGSGSEELNGTYDMMGNAWEWMESPYSDPSYDTDSSRGLRSGFWYYYSHILAAYYRNDADPMIEDYDTGFRVASVPEPGSIALLVCGLLSFACLKRWR
ncbi:MAG: SUMF1/EgtB/PvdO family nonheme iron enzyme, partial [Planctomycetota bacterium]|nr:SUMF1/EgtB/PvdO family nonheme iron enzyme [Planctomycetota bacterium]